MSSDEANRNLPAGGRVNSIQARWAEKVGKKPRTLYVSNFPKDWGCEDMKEFMEKLGPVRDIFMPNKRNADNKVNVEEILEVTKGLWIGYHKVLANFALFDRFEKPKVAAISRGKFVGPSRQIEKGRSFLQAATEDNGKVNDENGTGNGILPNVVSGVTEKVDEILVDRQISTAFTVKRNDSRNIFGGENEVVSVFNQDKKNHGMGKELYCWMRVEEDYRSRNWRIPTC